MDHIILAALPGELSMQIFCNYQFHFNIIYLKIKVFHTIIVLISGSFANKRRNYFVIPTVLPRPEEQTITNNFTESGFVSNIIISTIITIIPLNIHMIISFDMFISLKGRFFVYSIEYRGELV